MTRIISRQTWSHLNPQNTRYIYLLNRSFSTSNSFKSNNLNPKTKNAQIVQIENADVFKYGIVKRSDAIFKDLTWIVHPGECWVIVSDSNTVRGELLQTLLGRRRIQPVPHNGVFPFLKTGEPTTTSEAGVVLEKNDVLHVSFASSQNQPAGGGFVDYTARYGAMRDQDSQTLRERLLEQLSLDPPPPPPTELTRIQHAHNPTTKMNTTHDNNGIIDQMAIRLNLGPQLDIPMIALSNGQQRRARILRQLVKHPRVLLLENPFAGLDVIQRPLLSTLLQQLHSRRDPIIFIELRPQDPIPEWTTHVALVEGQRVQGITVNEYKSRHHALHTTAPITTAPKTEAEEGDELVGLKGVRVSYGKREVLKDITWSIHKGDRWHLKGPNGSGKTTLLSMLTGEHPQSYTQKHFNLFGLPRRQLPTVNISRQISMFSPEIFAAFPRKFGPGAMTVADAIGTGFESTYSFRNLSSEQKAKRDALILQLAPGETDTEKIRWAQQTFAVLPPSEQSLALLMRTLISNAPILILDEVFAGMDDQTIACASEYLRTGIGKDQAVIFVSHWEHEVPWKNVKKYMIENSIGRVA